MKLERPNSVFNLGDTSFRRKTLLNDYKVILPILKEHMEAGIRWEKNSAGQELFYKTIFNQTDLFDSTESNKPAQRGRTLTNALIKPGLINVNRHLSEVAVNWINNNTKQPDMLEQWLGLKIDNIVFLRQCFKLRVYDSEKNSYFYPFRVALEILINYPDIRESDFLNILHSIDPQMKEDKIYKIISNYKNVVDKVQSFEEFYQENLSATRKNDKVLLNKVEKLFAEEIVKEDDFQEIFYNGKSAKARKKYLYFYKAINSFKQNPTKANLITLIKKSKDGSIKKAFGFGKIPFKTSKKRNFSVEEFMKLNEDNFLLKDPNLFFKQFMSSKRVDLIKEYSDMTKRVFNLSGILSFSNKLVNLVQPWIFSKVVGTYRGKITLAGEESYKDYEVNLNSNFYKDLSLMEITGLTVSELLKIEDEIRTEYNITDIKSLAEVNDEKTEQKFRDLIDSKFNQSKIIDLLKLFKNRDANKDKKIQKAVSDSATVSTIFEYIVAIAWFHLSGRHFQIRKSVNLSLDGNFLPLTHATGGDGDIVIEFENFILMLEVTLMNKNAQKREELEPVIRHTANLAIRKLESDKQVFTIFIADELDDNVVNILRAVAFVQLDSTQQPDKEPINGVNIFALSISELIDLLEAKKDYRKLIDTIQENFLPTPTFVRKGWREEIVANLMNI